MAVSVREMALRFNASVTVLNAFNAVPEYVYGPSLDDPSVADQKTIPYSPAILELRHRQVRRLEEFSRIHFSGIGRGERIIDGEPETVIEWAATHENSDLIMMPTKGLGKFRRFVLGSVTAKVLHDLACPLFTSAHEPEPASASPSGRRSILCAVEMGHNEDVVFEAAGLFVQTYGSRVCLLHIQSPSSGDGNQPSIPSIKAAFDQACNAGERGIAADVCAHTLDASVPDAIRQVALEQDAGLVIVGRGHAREAFSRAWSHLYTIIRESPCPVLSVCKR